MSQFPSRWRDLTRAARHAPPASVVDAPSADRVRAIALRGLAVMRPRQAAVFQEWRSLALAASFALATGLGIWWSDVPVGPTTRQLMQELADLPTHVPRSPHVPSPAALLADLKSSTPWSDVLPVPSLAQPSVQETTP